MHFMEMEATVLAPTRPCPVLSPVESRSRAVSSSSSSSGSSSPERLRCTRRLRFVSVSPPNPVAVARRNERERNRVKQVNMGFQTLRQHVPSGAASKKMSKVETLRSAVEYIRALQRLVNEHDAAAAARVVPSPGASSASSAGAESPRSACSSSDECGGYYESYEPLSSEEHELLDFSTWFDGY